MDQFFAQLQALGLLVGAIWLLGLGFSLVLQRQGSYLGWSGRQMRALVRWAVRRALAIVQRLLRWTLRQLWRLVRWGVPALVRGFVGLLT